MEEITAIVEGADHDAPSRIGYVGIDFYIPTNACSLRIGARRFELYAREDMQSLKDCLEVLELQDKKGGWPLRDENSRNPDWLLFAIESQRSVVTRDGRVYVCETYFEKDWVWYLDIVPNIVQDCKEVFAGRKTLEDINSLGRRAF